MSVFSSIAKQLLDWGVQSAKTAAQRDGLAAVQSAMKELDSVVASHAPGVAPLITPAAESIVTALVAGLATKKQ